MDDILVQRKEESENGFHKNGYEEKWPKTQGSEKILREMSEGRLRSLEKCFFKRRNGVVKEKIQVEEGGE